MVDNTPKVNLSEIIDALDKRKELFRFFVNIKTGKVISLAKDQSFSDVDDEEEELGDPEDFVPLPGRWDLTEYEMMEDFCNSIDNPDVQAELIKAIQQKKVFSHFKRLVAEFNLAEQWTAHRHEQLKEIAIDFCNEYGLLYS